MDLLYLQQMLKTKPGTTLPKLYHALIAYYSNISMLSHPGIKPTLPKLLKFSCIDERVISIPVEIPTKYGQFGTYLLDDRTGSRVKIMAHKHHYDTERINTEILQEWPVV